ncbi:cytochrome P450 [Sphingomonas sp.]|uniref:cytochrome P450 n=1 Tax=Sphingomonas sp. TaxID=28214 RepID=UPI003AFF8E74
MNVQMPTSLVPDYVPADRVFQFDLYDRQGELRVAEDLHDSLRLLLKEAPDVFWTPCNGGHWVVTRSDLIAEVLRDPAHFSTSRTELPRTTEHYVAIPINLDPPVHTAYRRVLMQYFSPRPINSMTDKIRNRARDLIDAVKDDGGCDFVDKIAIPLPVTIFMEMMGWPTERYREFRALVDTLFSGPDDESRSALLQTILGELSQMIAERREHPTDDLMSKFLEDEVEGRKLTAEEVLSMCFFLFAAGLDTVANAASFLFRSLAMSPETQARLAADPSLIDDFIKEGLRTAGVVNTPRLVAKEVTLDGVTMQPDDIVVVMLPLVGMDDRIHADPQVFDLDRKNHTNMLFGMGVHLCAGHHLARLELKILAEEWVKAIPSFRIAPDHRAVFRMGPVMALRDLPLTWPVDGANETVRATVDVVG